MTAAGRVGKRQGLTGVDRSGRFGRRRCSAAGACRRQATLAVWCLLAVGTTAMVVPLGPATAAAGKVQGSAAPASKAPADFDGNGTTDRSVYRGGAWYAEGQATGYLGGPGDIPVPGDYDGDGRTDRAVFRPSVGAWYIEGKPTVFLGVAGDIPVPGDYNGDGRTDPGVFRPSTGGWYTSGQATVYLGVSGDIPVPGDYDGDGTTDRGVWRPSSGGWYVAGQATAFLGLSGDVPEPGDYDGNGSTDRAIWRSSVGGWYVDGQPTAFLGVNGDVPIPLPQAIYRAAFGGALLGVSSDPGNVTTVAGGGQPPDGLGDGGPALDAQLDAPAAVVAGTGPSGTRRVAYIADGLRVRRVRFPDEPGAVPIIDSVANDIATSTPRYPAGLAVDAGGDLYIADKAYNRVLHLDLAGNLRTVVGSEGGLGGFFGDGGLATKAKLQFPRAVAVDAAGNLYIADTENARVRRVDAGADGVVNGGNDETITTVAGRVGDGNANFGGDGGLATDAALGLPLGLAVDPAGNLLVAVLDVARGIYRVRQVDTGGRITTVAGGGSPVDGLGDGGPATAAALSFGVNGTAGVAVEPSGDVLVADSGHHRIRRVDAAGTITTVAGTGVAGFSGDGGPATEAAFHTPAGVAVDAAGDVFVADTGNGRVRRVAMAPTEQPSLRIYDATVTEGHDGPTTATFVVHLSRKATAPVSVDFATADGTGRAAATAGADYVPASGTLSFQAGEQTKAVTVAVVGDRVAEPDESFTVSLANATGATLSRPVGVGTILNDDGPIPALSVADVRAVEGDGGTTPMTFHVSLAPASAGPVSVRYATAAGDAESGIDFVPASGTLNFAPGETAATVAVSVVGDTIEESDEHLTLALFDPSGATLGRDASIGTILDDDGMWRSTPPLAEARPTATATTLDGPACAVPGAKVACGAVLVAGWTAPEVPDAGPTPSPVEVYAADTWTKSADLPLARTGHSATLLAGPACAAPSAAAGCGTVLVAGGTVLVAHRSRATGDARRFDPSSGTWVAAGAMAHPRTGHTATLLSDGDVLVAGGASFDKRTEGMSTAGNAEAEIFRPGDGTWSGAGALATPRTTHTATVLDGPACRAAPPTPPWCGRVLVTGGTARTDPTRPEVLASTEIYDPATATWALGPALSVPRSSHTATVLDGPRCRAPMPAPWCGKVLVAGGLTPATGEGIDNEPVPVSSAELYDPATGSWSPAGELATPRAYHVAAALDGAPCREDPAPLWCGTVLVAGGSSVGRLASDQVNDPVASAEVYDPAANAWELTATMRSMRAGAATARLPDDSVLVIGGNAMSAEGTLEPLASAERYLPAAGPGGPQVSAIEPFAGPTFGGTEVTIRGRGLLLAPAVSFGGVPATAVRVRSDTEIVATTPPAPQGGVDVAVATAVGRTGSATRFTYGPGAWATTGSMTAARMGHVAVLLDGVACHGSAPPGYCGKVLVAGRAGLKGAGGQFPGVASAELYDPATGRFTPTGSMTTERAGDPKVFAPFTATLLDGPACRGATPAGWCGEVLVTGGVAVIDEVKIQTLASAELYDPASGSWRLTDPMTVARAGHTATLLGDGSVLVAGGTTDAASGEYPSTAAAEVYDPAEGKWRPVQPMAVARELHTATLLPTGDVLVTGGAGEPQGFNVHVLASAELYHPRTGKWRRGRDLAVERASHTATVISGPGCGLDCGKVLVVGGAGVSRVLRSTELYDPATDRWAPGGLLGVGRSNHSAVLLANGRVLLAGGFLPTGRAGTAAEEFDPISNQIRVTSAIPAGYAAMTATLLDGPACRAAPPGYCGTVLFAGGGDQDTRNYTERILNHSAAAERYIPAPEVTAVSPGTGPSRGGTPATIAGTGLAGAGAVRFGGAVATQLSLRSATELVAVTPAHPSGPVAVVVDGPGGTSARREPTAAARYAFVVSRAPARVTDLQAVVTSDTSLMLTWSAPPSDGAFPPPATRFALHQSSDTPLTDEASFAAAQSLCGGECRFSLSTVGERVSLSVSELRPGTTYNYALRAVADTGEGPLSNAVSARTLGTVPSPLVAGKVVQAPSASLASRHVATSVPPSTVVTTTTSTTLPPTRFALGEVAAPAAPAPPAPARRGGGVRWVLWAMAVLGAASAGFVAPRLGRRRSGGR